ncbi:hypothetical protein DRO59_00260 [Candidatus Bathyarchaeota archaeon]|nr:MAG: hypothetical protein DRO59_00260 [Candidatus Bathyarchaeota archaeon]
MAKSDDKTENPKPSAIMLELASVRKKLDDIYARLKEHEDHLIATRELSILQNETLPFINFQFKQQLFNTWALTQSLHEVEKEVALRYGSFQNAMRDLSREQEKAAYLAKYVDTMLRNYYEIRNENVMLKQKIDELKNQMEAKDMQIKAMKGITQEINRLITQRKLPPDIIAELQRILPEIPRPVTRPIKEEEEIL